MHSFRKKVLISYLVVLGLFFALMFPFVTNSVQQIVFHSMKDRAQTIIKKLSCAHSQKELLSLLKDEKHLHFYRIGITDQFRTVLYDSHIRDIHNRMNAHILPLRFSTSSEVEEAFRNGTGYVEAYSHQVGQKLISFAERFDFQGRPYVLRIAFPYQYTQELKENFTFGFLLFGGLVLLLFFLLTTLIMNYLSSPIREIMKAIGNYQEGRLETLPRIELKGHRQDEFYLLAKTVTSLSDQIKKEISIISTERNERDALLESLQAGVFVLQPNSTIAYLNSTAAEMLDLTKNSIGALLPNSLPFDAPSLMEKALIRQEPISLDIQLKKNTSIVYIHLIVIPKEDEGAIFVLHDRSQEYRMLEMRKAFIANASHELKTPITIIKGFAETLGDHPELPRETIQDITKRISDSCSRMTHLIRNLLLLSDIEHLPSYRIVAIDLIQLISTCFETIHHAHPQATLTLICSQNEVYIQGAPEILEMAFTNILDNGAKYSEQPAHCTVTIHEENDAIIIQIEDQGIGISEEDLPHIFQRFFRGSKAGMKKYSGSGLGLSITDTIISKHRGSITVQSTLGKGTIFTISLPRHLKKLIDT